MKITKIFNQEIFINKMSIYIGFSLYKLYMQLFIETYSDTYISSDINFAIFKAIYKLKISLKIKIIIINVFNIYIFSD